VDAGNVFGCSRDHPRSRHRACGRGGPARPVRVGPVIRDEPAMPTQDRLRPDHEDGPAVTAEPTRERGEDRTVVGFSPRTRDLALEYGELVAQRGSRHLRNGRVERVGPGDRSRGEQVGRNGAKVDARVVRTGPLTATRNACSACPDAYSAPTAFKRPRLERAETLGVLPGDRNQLVV
jgi:hypothetical protein